MLAPILISLLCYEASCTVIPVSSASYSNELIKCITDIVTDYFAPLKMLTYVGNKQDDDEFLKAIHDLNVVTMMSRRSSKKLSVYHEGYFISARNYSVFTSRFPNLIKESTWNPNARFLLLVKGLQEDQLLYIFNRLLMQHVINVIVVNATDDAHLYSYNPFDNYGCGKRYDDIISYGKCSQAHMHDLYPYKYVTELQNCTFTVAIPHWPPYTIYSINSTDTSSPFSHGIEPFLLEMVGKMRGFSINIIFNKEYNSSDSTVSSDMEAAGPLKLLQRNEADVILGGLLLTPSRAVAFDYVFDLLPYIDEIRFFVKRASFVPPWKNVYLEFDSTVWILIVLSLVLYSIVMIILLGTTDKSLVVLKLLDSLMLHSWKIEAKSTVKVIFIIWVWFACLINAFYQSSLFSLTTNPAKESQISTEDEILRHNLKPCFSELMENYYMESTRSQYNYTPVPGCHGATESIKTVMNSKEFYTIFLYGLYKYHIQEFLDDYGKTHIYALSRPYSKVFYCMYFYKGFPLVHDLRVSALRLREMGLVSKGLHDIKTKKLIKQHYRAKAYRSHYAIPWRIYFCGCAIATITFIVEILSKYK